jgi:anaerobic selenocysteine-containing dehydrogenase
MIVIDPRYTDTAAGREDEWIPIRPGTDAALVAGIAWVLIDENLVDQPFLDTYCVGYDEKTLPEGPGQRTLQSVYSRPRRRYRQNAPVGVAHHRHSGGSHH